MLDAIKYYPTKSEVSFICYLKNTLKTAFSYTAGFRTKKQLNEPLNNYKSLNATVKNDENDTEFIELVADETASTFHEVEFHQIHEILFREIEKLDESYKKIITLKYYKNLSARRIAEILGLSVSTVIQRERKALIKLRLNNHIKSLY